MGWYPNGGGFHIYRNYLFSGRSISRLGAPPLLYIRVIISSLAALFALASNN